MSRTFGSRIGVPVGAAAAISAAFLVIAALGGGAAASAKVASAKTKTTPATSSTVVRAALPAGSIQNILVIELENESYQTTFGPGSPATYLNGTLLKQGELIPHYYATGHVSLDNYLAQVAGQAPTDDTASDCIDNGAAFANITPGTPAKNQTEYPGQVNGDGCVYPKSVPTIASQLDALYPPNRTTHVASWRGYDEDMGNVPARDGGTADPLGGTDCAHPAIGQPNLTNTAAAATATTPADQYASRHNPFVWFHSVIDNTAECNANVVPLGTVKVGQPSTFNGVSLPDTFSGHLVNDLSKASTTPKFGFLTPNLCDDGHDATCAGTNTDGATGAGSGGLVGADAFLSHWMPLIEASPAYKSGHMLVLITFDEAATTDGSSCCNEQPGPDDPTPGNSPLLAQYGIAAPALTSGGGQVGAVLLDPKYIKPGSVDNTGYYNHYSALRSYEDLLGITTGGVDGDGHIGFAAAKGLKPFGADVFNNYKAPKKKS